MTQATDALAVIQQVQTDIGPGVSGWVATELSSDEGTEMRSWIYNAQETLLMDPDSDYGKDIRNIVYGRIIFNLDDTALPADYWQVELDITAPGTRLVAVSNTEDYFQNEVDEEGGPAAFGKGRP